MQRNTEHLFYSIRLTVKHVKRRGCKPKSRRKAVTADIVKALEDEGLFQMKSPFI